MVEADERQGRRIKQAEGQTEGALTTHEAADRAGVDVQAAAGAGIILGGQNNLVYDNLIYDENNGQGIEVDYSDPENNEIVLNTIYNVAGYCIVIGFDSSPVGTVVKDNILYDCGSGPIYPSDTVMDAADGIVRSHNRS